MSTPEAAVGFDALLVLRTLKWYSFLAISPSINYLLWCTRPARPHPRLPPPGVGPGTIIGPAEGPTPWGAPTSSTRKSATSARGLEELASDPAGRLAASGSGGNQPSATFSRLKGPG